MGLNRWSATLGAIFVSGFGSAWAADVHLGQMTLGYTYYNRAGADLERHNRDVIDCAVLAGSVHSLSAIWATDTSAPISFGWGSRPVDRSLAAASLENCMVVRGWRVVRVPAPEGEALAALPAGELSRRLEPWIGAESPHGAIVRVWDNDAAHGRTDRYSSDPRRTRNGQLSLLAAAPERHDLPPPPMREPPSPWVNPRWPRKPLKPADIASVRPDAAVLLVMIKGLGLHAGRGIIFNREGPNPDTSPSAADHAPDIAIVSKGLLFASPSGDMFAMALPPGRWRLYGIGVTPTLNLCLGSPAFELEAGQVVYAGAFDLSADELGPDLDLAPAKSWLGKGADAIKAAIYTNGSRGPCGDNTIYALEFRGVPFEAGQPSGGGPRPR